MRKSRITYTGNVNLRPQGDSWGAIFNDALEQLDQVAHDPNGDTLSLTRVRGWGERWQVHHNTALLGQVRRRAGAWEALDVHGEAVATGMPSRDEAARALQERRTDR